MNYIMMAYVVCLLNAISKKTYWKYRIILEEKLKHRILQPRVKYVFSVSTAVEIILLPHAQKTCKTMINYTGTNLLKLDFLYGFSWIKYSKERLQERLFVVNRAGSYGVKHILVLEYINYSFLVDSVYGIKRQNNRKNSILFLEQVHFYTFLQVSVDGKNKKKCIQIFSNVPNVTFHSNPFRQKKISYIHTFRKILTSNSTFFIHQKVVTFSLWQ